MGVSEEHEQAVECIGRICNATHTGAEISVVRNGIRILHLGHFTQTQMDLIQMQYPNFSFEIRESDMSSSGFSIFVHFGGQFSLARNLFCLFALASVTFLAVLYNLWANYGAIFVNGRGGSESPMDGDGGEACAQYDDVHGTCLSQMAFEYS